MTIEELLEKKGYEVEIYTDEMIISYQGKWKATFSRLREDTPWLCRWSGDLHVTTDNVLALIK